MEGQDARDLGDSVRLEASAAPPAVDQKMQELLGEFAGFIEQDYGSFMRADMKTQGRQAINNTIITDDVFEADDAWRIDFAENNLDLATALSAPLRRSKLLGTHNVTGDAPINFLQSSESKLPRLTPKQKEQLESDAKEKNMSPEDMMMVMMGEAGIHELIHAYIPQDTPHDVNEFVTRELTVRLITKHYGSDPTEEVSTPYSTLFNKLTAKYGNDFYRAVFGALRNPLTKFRIFRDLNENELKGLV